MNDEPELRILISHRKIASTVIRLADEIRRDYRENNPLVIGVLKGSFMFLADLIRRLDIPLEVDFIRLSSYGPLTESSGVITVTHEISSVIKGRHVLLVEDIVDTGLTVAFLMDYFKRKQPASLKLCALADKPARRKVAVDIDYLGFTVPDMFLVGYGVDWNEKYRNLPDIYYIVK